MAGQRLNRVSSRAQLFAQSMIDQAEQRANRDLTRSISVGPHTVSLQFTASGWLTELIAGAFLVSPGSEANPTPLGIAETKVTICQHGDGVALPNLDWAHKWIIEGSVVPNQLTAPYRVFVDRNQGIIYCYNPEENRAAIYLRNPRDLDLRSFITPFRLLWSWIATISSSLVLHAAAVGINQQGVLLSGPSGSGKSTLAAATGMVGDNSILADDCVLVHEQTVYAIYSRIKIEPQNVRALRFPDQVEVQSLQGAEYAKSFIQIDSNFPDFTRTLNASALVFPAIYDRAGFYELPKKRSLSMLTSDSMRELFSGTPLARRGIDRLVSALPTYRLLLEQNALENVKNLERLVAHGTK